MRKLVRIGLMLLCCTATTAQAAGVDLSLGSKTAQFNFNTDSSSLGYGGADISFGAFYNTDKDLVGSVGAMVSGAPAGTRPFSFGVGAKIYVASLDKPNKDVQAISIGGQVAYHIPGNIPMAVVVRGFYAPEVTTFGDGKDYLDLFPHFSVEFLPGTSAFVGYRYMRTHIKHADDYKMADEAVVGVKLTF
ncbi:MAG: YfaZ family outer membrane protein [Gammaproteobacteria bacterium]|jgi:hypothetical protein